MRDNTRFICYGQQDKIFRFKGVCMSKEVYFLKFLSSLFYLSWFAKQQIKYKS